MSEEEQEGMVGHNRGKILRLVENLWFCQNREDYTPGFCNARRQRDVYTIKKIRQNIRGAGDDRTQQRQDPQTCWKLWASSKQGRLKSGFYSVRKQRDFIGLGIRSSVFWLNRLFLWSKDRFDREKDWIAPSTFFKIRRIDSLPVDHF